jgi:peptidylprolyl isomerase
MHAVAVPVRVCAALLFSGALLGSAPVVAGPQDKGSALVGRAGTVELGEAELRQLLDALPESGRQQLLASPAALSQAVRSELLRRAMLAEARAKGFDKDAKVAAELARLRDEVVLRLWVAQEAKLPDGFPSEDELARAYQALRERAAGASDYRLAQIYVAAPNGATPDQLRTALRKVAEIQAKLAGGDFAALAKAYSEHAESASKGGDLGLLPESQLLPEVRAALPTLKPGETAGPIKTSQGIHFVRLIERRGAVVPPLADVRDNLAAALRQEKSKDLQQRYLKDLAAKYPPTINELALGSFATSR